MATTIVTKSGSGAPTASDLVAGELAVDLTNKRLYTEDSGGTVLELGTNPASDVTFGDSTKAIFGAGSDLQIYHNATSNIIDSSAATLAIQAPQFVVQDATGAKNMVWVPQNGGAYEVQLSHDGSTKLTTTATGIDVTGTVTADGLTVANTSVIAGDFDGGTAATYIRLQDDTDNFLFGSNNSLGNFLIKNETADALRLSVANTGDISFYEDTGTTPKFFWDASAESLGIGTGSPSTGLDVATTNYTFSGTTYDIYGLFGDTSGGVRLGADSSNDDSVIGTTGTNDLQFVTYNGSAWGSRMTLSNTGNVGIGRASIDQPSSGATTLAIQGTENSKAGAIRLYSADDSVSAYIYPDSVSGLSINTSTSHPMVFRTAGVEALRIDALGRVGIGTSSPAAAKFSSTPDGVLNVSGSKPVVYLTEEDETDSNVWMGLSNEVGIIGNTGDGLAFRTGSSTATEAMRIDSLGNVGLNSTAPVDQLEINGGAAYPHIRLRSSTNTSRYMRIGMTDSTTHTVEANGTGTSLAFRTSGSERLRINSSGTLTVGTTDEAVGVGNTNLGHSFGASGYAAHSRSANASLFLNRTTSDGNIIQFSRDGATIGSIGSVSGDLVIAESTTGLRFDGENNQILPSSATGSTDSTCNLGASSVRFKDIYRSGSTFSTSDRTMKQDIRDLTDAERNVAVACKGLLKAFRFIRTVEKEGDAANIHFGIMAQDLAAAFAAEGLDANDYQVYKSIVTTDEDGNEQTRLNVCYENLLAFIIAAI